MSEQKKAIDMTPEELKQWLSSLTVPEDDEIPRCYFSASDPYLKHEPLDPNRVARDISFDDDGNIHIKNISALLTQELDSTMHQLVHNWYPVNAS